MKPPSFSDPQGFMFFPPWCSEGSLSSEGRKGGWGEEGGRSALEAETTDIVSTFLQKHLMLGMHLRQITDDNRENKIQCRGNCQKDK